MNPIDILEEAIKSKSWVAARLALKALKEKPDQPWIVQGAKQTTVVEKLMPGPIQTATTTSTNKFFDDGQTVRVGDISIDPAIEDKKWKPNKTVARNRAEHQQRQLTCSICNRPENVDDQTYSYNMFLSKEKDEAGNIVGNQFKCNKCV